MAEPDDTLAPAAGTPAAPIDPGEYQPGDLSERAQQLGGPVDIYPARKLPGMETPSAGDEVPQSERTGEELPDQT